MMFNDKCPFKIMSFLTSVIILLACSAAFSNDLGVFGQVYPISEENFLEFIKSRLIQMQQNGEWDKLQNQFRDNVKKHAEKPSPVSFISKTVTPKTWYYDPSMTVPYDLKDYNGRVFAKAGTTVNPLKMITLHHVLVFYDGDDQSQVHWAEKINQLYANHTKLILVKGSVGDQEKNFSMPIYFDQEGRLTSKFNIQHVPAIVQQDNLNLKISEVVP